MERKPSKRLGFNGIEEIKNHPWFSDMNWSDLANHKMPSPFIPKHGDNFDKKYCEAKEKIGEDTIERYQDYMQDEDYIDLFEGYTIINYSFPKKSKFSENNGVSIGKFNSITKNNHHKAISLFSTKKKDKNNEKQFPHDLLMNKSSSVKIFPKKPTNLQRNNMKLYIKSEKKLKLEISIKTSNDNHFDHNRINYIVNRANTQRAQDKHTLTGISKSRRGVFSNKQLPAISNVLSNHKSYSNVFQKNGTLSIQKGAKKHYFSSRKMINVNDIIEKKQPKIKITVNSKK